MKTARKPLTTVNLNKNGTAINDIDENITVEKYLENQLNILIKDFQNHSENIIKKIHSEYDEGAKSIQNLLQKTKSEEKKLCVNLKCIAGSHIGQRFRLEPVTENGEDIFKIGRSTGKLFKEKGVSLYKDKEISTTHAKIEIRNGQAFVIDMNSTNGTQINSAEIDPAVPYRLNDGDVIAIGSTELTCHIAATEQ